VWKIGQLTAIRQVHKVFLAQIKSVLATPIDRIGHLHLDLEASCVTTGLGSQWVTFLIWTSSGWWKTVLPQPILGMYVRWAAVSTWTRCG
jgi:hypothetical protein